MKHILLGLVMGGFLLQLTAANEEVVFQDRFDGKLAAGWSWLRENTNTWRLRDQALEIRVEPGGGDTVRNALVRPAPERAQGKFAIEVTVCNRTVPTQQFEQAGITWYSGGKPVFKLVKELVDGQLMIIPSRKPMTNECVQLRLVVTAGQYVAQFRPDAKGEFQTAAAGPLPPGAAEQASLQCYNGPPNAEHWIRFTDFRILKLSE